MSTGSLETDSVSDGEEETSPSTTEKDILSAGSLC